MTEMSEAAAIEKLQEHGLTDQSENYKLSRNEIANASDDLLQLLDQVDKEVVGWRPSAGDKIVGTVRDITEAETGDFGEYPIITIETPNHSFVAVHAFHTILKRDVERRMLRGTLRQGDEIAIAYVGQGVAQGGKNAPEMYRVAVRRPERKES